MDWFLACKQKGVSRIRLRRVIIDQHYLRRMNESKMPEMILLCLRSFCATYGWIDQVEYHTIFIVIYRYLSVKQSYKFLVRVKFKVRWLKCWLTTAHAFSN